MDPLTIVAYIQAGALLVNFGKATVEQVRAMFAAHPAMTEDELNLIVDAVRSDAERRKALADADSGR